MRRVSSRQRLVSWDAFDAAASSDESDEEQDFITCHEAPLSRNSSFGELLVLDSNIQPLRRKREREPSVMAISSTNMKKNVSFSDLVPVVISAHSWEVEESPVVNLIEKPSTLLPLDSLIDDVQLHVLSFLTVAEARKMALVSKQYRQLLASQEAMTLWKAWFQRRWPSIQTTLLHFVDLLQLPTVLTQNHTQPNMGVLLGMAARHYPTKIDESQQTPPTLARLRRVSSTSNRTMFRTLQVEGRTVTQYLGPIGTGDRCIRADQPLAGPERLGLWSSFANKASLLDFLCRGARAVAGSTPPWRPFVAPYITKSGEKTQVHLTPRLVSYYEVSILSCPEDSPLVRTTTTTANPFAPPNGVTDCVAVGVATGTFHLHSRMPGWDAHSYGYHGDDGGIFHASGDMTRRFGPSFGQGDTVGCGVDYVTGGIFYTLNGDFLGYGWTGVDVDFLQQELYPTIGVDSNCPIACNFGERPFEFDLTAVVERQKDLVKECWNTRTPEGFPAAAI